MTPSLQFVLGVTLLDEHMSSMRWVGFALVWVALVIFTVDASRAHGRQLRLAAESSAV
jgi:chloramphenicol-sensitive protein RarD